MALKWNSMKVNSVRESITVDTDLRVNGYLEATNSTINNASS